MAKLSVIVLALASLIFNTLADPIFLLSSKRINDISRNLFFDTDSFNNLLNDKLLLKESLPDNIFVFNVNLNNKKYVADPSLILSEIASYPALQKYFGSSSNTFSSIYVKDALSPEFSEKVIKNIENAGDFQLSQSNLNEFNFNQVEDLRKTHNKNILSVTNVPMTELKSLNGLFSQVYSNFTRVSGDNHLIMLKFTDDSDGSAVPALAQLEINERLLQDDEPVVNPDNTPAADDSNTVGDGTNSIGISPAGLTGYVISLFLLVGVYIGFQVMQDIKGPTRFYKEVLQIGKEQ